MFRHITPSILALVVFGSPFAALALCILVFGTLYLCGEHFSREQVEAVAMIQTTFWYLAIPVWIIKLLRQRP